ncbi:hypothetical protein K466DRAFT_302893 [Polyporus arcularius HHB13444]|uniref:Uncharacterized protein n=1 Tax=Polyporus arcularius HHB13444 TaxID=1314778 RepID=A0A5C3P237_9APHY|nr:hypothetical protein K466DRAFT_302893 [Polyporus arcularius HHB13444]
MATTDSKAAVARTRSQTTLDAFFSRPLDLAASPLKQARRNVAASERPDPLPSSSADISADDDDDPMHDHHYKRPSSPAKDAALLHERDHKRPRHGVFPPPKPSSLPPDPPSATTLPARAKSVPPLPLLDLNNVPPSPRRSPAKFRIASVPPEQPPSPPPKTPTFIFEPSTPNPHIPDTCMTPMSPLTPLPTNGDNTLDITLDADATPVPKSPKPLLFTQPPPPVVTAVAPHPKPPSSFIPRASGVKARMRPKGVSTAAAEHAGPAKKVRNPRDQDKKNNILGGLISSVKPMPAQAYKRAQSQPPTPSYLMPTTSSVARVSPAKPAPVHVVPRPAPRSRSMSRLPPAVPKLREISKHRQPPELSQPQVESAREERPMSRGPPAVPKLREPLNMSQDRGLEPPETFEDMPQVESTREERSMSREPPAVPKLRETSNHRQPSELSQPQVESAREEPSMSRGPPAVPKLRLEPPETSEGKKTFEDMPQIECALSCSVTAGRC